MVIFYQILFLILMVISLASPAQITLPSNKSLYILDGDSLNIKTRIKGIDTPEIKQKCQPTSRKTIDCGRLAKQHLRQLLKKTRGQLKIEIEGFDGYHRALVSVQKGQTDIAKQMVLDGFAFSYYRYPEAEKLARNNGRGFWAFFKPPITPSKWRKNHKKIR